MLNFPQHPLGSLLTFTAFPDLSALNTPECPVVDTPDPASPWSHLPFTRSRSSPSLSSSFFFFFFSNFFKTFFRYSIHEFAMRTTSLIWLFSSALLLANAAPVPVRLVTSSPLTILKRGLLFSWIRLNWRTLVTVIPSRF